MKKSKKIVSKKEQKEQKGITLIVLVVTIVVIIIVASVSLGYTFGFNGLMTRAMQVDEFYSNDTIYTQESVSNLIVRMDEVINEIKT